MLPTFFFFFFFNDTATTEIYTLSLHDALPISKRRVGNHAAVGVGSVVARVLELLLQHPDHRERQAIDDDALTGGIDALAEDSLRQLIAEEQHAPPARDVGGVDEASTRRGGHVADRLVFGPHALEERVRSEEHTSELQSLAYLVCRLLLEKKKI